MGSHSRPVATYALIRIDLVRRSSAIVRDGGTTEMSPWRVPRHLRYGKPSFCAWQDKTPLNLFIGGEPSRPSGRAFSAWAVSALGSREQNVGITYVGRCTRVMPILSGSYAFLRWTAQ